MNLSQKIAAAAGALTLTATGIAAAAPPEAADKGLARAEANVDFDLPVAGANAPSEDGVNDEPDTDVVAEDDMTEDGEDVGGQGGPSDNHGAEVSAVAQTEHPTGREHGEAVSTVALGEHGPDAANDPAGETEDDATGGEANEAGPGRGRK